MTLQGMRFDKLSANGVLQTFLKRFAANVAARPN